MRIPSFTDPEFTARVQRLVRSRLGLWILGVISFLESALPIPIITDPFMIVYILADRSKTLIAVLVTTATSVLGGVAAYIAAFFFQAFVLSFFSAEAHAELIPLIERFRDETFILTILGAITPIPYTFVAVAAGFVKGNLLVFILASCLGRFVRYAVVGYLTYQFGSQAIVRIRRNLVVLSVVTGVAAVLYILLW